VSDDPVVPIEPERYELFARPIHRFELDRRDLLKTFGGGLLILLIASDLDAQESGARALQGDRMPQDVTAWLHIADSGAVTVFTGKTEIGQNIRTSLTQAVAEELGASTAAITVVMADTAKTPFDMGTFGSRTTPTMNQQLRKASAAAREALVARAAARWNTPPNALTVKDGRVHDAKGSSFTFGELLTGSPLVAAVSEKTPLKPAAAWTVAGTALPKINGRGFVTGRHRYTSDLTSTGMLHGKVVRPPAYGATLVRMDATEAEMMAGVIVVRDGNFIGIGAPTAAAASAAAASINAEWSAGSGVSARTLFGDLKTNLEGAGRPAVIGSIEQGLTAADVRVDAQYTVAYIAHAPLEPRAAVADWQNGMLTVWTGTQRPFGVQSELAEAFRLPAGSVRVIVPDTGSAYGGKHTGDAAIEAARIARAAKKPVKLVWTRAEEFTWAYFRPAGVIDIRSGVRTDGIVTAWEYHNYNSGPSGLPTPYEIANQHVVFQPSRSPLRQGSYRGLAATANHFARESHMDDLAHAAAIDPVEFRLKNLKDERLIAVLRAAAGKAGWTSRAKAPGRGYGIACGLEKGGYTAAYVELDVAAGARLKADTVQLRIRRIVAVFECGAIVNPNGLHNQVEGAVVQGLGGALFEAIDYEDGRLTNGHFAGYRLPRFSDLPTIEVVLLDRRDLPSAGSGETPIVSVAPAIGNAIFDATGTRLRTLPMVPHGLPITTSQI
jgi:nicotinate dehydrogenase subunit B